VRTLGLLLIDNHDWISFPFLLFDRHALGEVPRLVNVGAAQHSNVVCEQLQRQRERERRDQLAAWRQCDDMVIALRQVPGYVGVGQHE